MSVQPKYINKYLNKLDKGYESIILRFEEDLAGYFSKGILKKIEKLHIISQKTIRNLHTFTNPPLSLSSLAKDITWLLIKDGTPEEFFKLLVFTKYGFILGLGKVGGGI